jgi:hypothetical protein
VATRWVIPVPTVGILAARLTTSTRARNWSSKGPVARSGRQDTAHRITDRCVDDRREPEGKALQVPVQSLGPGQALTPGDPGAGSGPGAD